MQVKQQFYVYGRVQGVGFRYFTWRQASSFGLKGMVRNLADGSVHCIAVGEAEIVENFYQWLLQGPKTSKVERVVRKDYLGDREFTDFQIERDGV